MYSVIIRSDISGSLADKWGRLQKQENSFHKTISNTLQLSLLSIHICEKLTQHLAQHFENLDKKNYKLGLCTK